jgi:7,8-dihydropterin-6-yl-methyl-4-(beta-D-ribofuranosyl)aminobenzene 5'-phosphate synthase
MKITILYDNEALDGTLCTGWGFSCFIEVGEERLLFDTAWDGDQVITNARRLGVRLEGVTTVFLSHKHWDHLGGLARLLGVIPGARVVLPASFSVRLKREIARQAAAVVEVSDARSVGPGIHSTGELDTGAEDLREQALLVEAGDGLVLVTGCAHPGLDRLLALGEARGRVTAAIGGFHGFEALDGLASLQTIVPCHCTVKKEAILARFPSTARRGGGGLELVLGGE